VQIQLREILMEALFDLFPTLLTLPSSTGLSGSLVLPPCSFFVRSRQRGSAPKRFLELPAYSEPFFSGRPCLSRRIACTRRNCPPTDVCYPPLPHSPGGRLCASNDALLPLLTPVTCILFPMAPAQRDHRTPFFLLFSAWWRPFLFIR